MWKSPASNVDSDSSVDSLLNPSSHLRCMQMPATTTTHQPLQTSDGGGHHNMGSRKKRRGMIEKRRRDRINNSLNELRRLVPAAFEKQGSAKLEKAEILQMTVDHLTMLHAKGFDAFSFDPHKFAMDYHSIGFRECASETARYMVAVEGMDLQEPLRLRIMSHLQCYAAQRELALKSSAHASSWNPSAFTTPPHQFATPAIPPPPTHHHSHSHPTSDATPSTTSSSSWSHAGSNVPSSTTPSSSPSSSACSSSQEGNHHPHHQMSIHGHMIPPPPLFKSSGSPPPSPFPHLSAGAPIATTTASSGSFAPSQVPSYTHPSMMPMSSMGTQSGNGGSMAPPSGPHYHPHQYLGHSGYGHPSGSGSVQHGSGSGPKCYRPWGAELAY